MRLANIVCWQVHIIHIFYIMSNREFTSIIKSQICPFRLHRRVDYWPWYVLSECPLALFCASLI